MLPTVTNLFYMACVSNAIALVGRMGSKLLILVNNYTRFEVIVTTTL